MRLTRHARPQHAPKRGTAVVAEAMKALIFDCDGVILESEDLHRKAYNAAFEHFGLWIGGSHAVQHHDSVRCMAEMVHSQALQVFPLHLSSYACCRTCVAVTEYRSTRSHNDAWQDGNPGRQLQSVQVANRSSPL